MYLRSRTAQEWEALFTANGVPMSHVRQVKDVIAEEQVLARKMVKPVRLASGRQIQTWGIPIKVNEQVEARKLSVPGLDQHRAEILLELERLTEHQ